MTWISVTDQVPMAKPYSARVLGVVTYAPEGGNLGGTTIKLVWLMDGEWFQDGGSIEPLSHQGFKVTHWQPLPELPEPTR